MLDGRCRRASAAVRVRQEVRHVAAPARRLPRAGGYRPRGARCLPEGESLPRPPRRVWGDLRGPRLHRVVLGAWPLGHRPRAAGARHDPPIRRGVVRSAGGGCRAGAHRLEISPEPGIGRLRLRRLGLVRVARPAAGRRAGDAAAGHAAGAVPRARPAQGAGPAAHRLHPCARGGAGVEPARSRRRNVAAHPQ